jgi:crossover junction endodeoxyribonuclease RuvC
MIYVGVDPGQKGGYAVISTSETGQEVFAYPWDDTFFVMEMQALSRMGNGIVAAVEKVGAMPGQGVTSMFNFGMNFGWIQGVLQAYGIPYELIRPQKWKKEFSVTGDKNSSIAVCKRLFPTVSLLPTEKCRKDNDGMAEALLLSEYARGKL